MKQGDPRDIFKCAFSECLYIHRFSFSWPLASYSIFFSYEDSSQPRRRPW